MDKICNYIVPVFFQFENKDNTIIFHAQKAKFDTFNSVIKKENVNDFLFELFCWVPKTRYVFIGSKKNFTSVITPDITDKWMGKLVKKAAKTMTAEIFNYVDIDPFFERLSNDVICSLDMIRNAYHDILDKNTWPNYVENHIHTNEESEKAFKDISWMQMMVMGMNPEDIFQKCGNHMLPDNFDLSYYKNQIETAKLYIDLEVNKVTFISEIESKSILNTSKVYYFIELNNENVKLSFRVHNGDLSFDVSIDEIDTIMDQLSVLIPTRRIFITFGDENIKNAKTIYEKTLIPFFLELFESSVDYKKPFNSLLSPSFEEMLNYFSLNMQKTKTLSLQKLDEIIFKDVNKSFEILNDAVFNKFLEGFPVSSSKINDIKKQYTNMINSTIGQSLKYIYSHTAI